MAGLWEFPRGKIEENEDSSQALIREIQEELSISISLIVPIIDYTYNSEHLTIEMQSYKCYSSDYKISIIDHDKIEWITAGDLNNFKFAPADNTISEILKRGN